MKTRITRMIASQHPHGVFFVFGEMLSDGSLAHNVGMTDAAGQLVIAAVSRQAAFALADALNEKASWVQFTPAPVRGGAL